MSDRPDPRAVITEAKALAATDPAGALALLEDALRELDRAGDADGAAQVALVLGVQRSDARDHVGALSAIERACAHEERSGNTRALATALHALARALTKAHRYADALVPAGRAVALAERVLEPQHVVILRRDVAAPLFLLHRHAEAVARLLETVTPGFGPLHAGLRTALFRSLVELGRLREARHAWSPDLDEAGVLGATLDVAQGEIERGRAVLEARLTGDAPLLGWALVAVPLLKAHLAGYRPDEAARVLRILEERTPRHELLPLWRAQVHQLFRRPSEALAALDALRLDPSATPTMQAAALRAEILRDLGDVVGAEELALRALRDLDPAVAPGPWCEVALVRALLDADRGRLAEARALVGRVRAVLDQQLVGLASELGVRLYRATLAIEAAPAIPAAPDPSGTEVSGVEEWVVPAMVDATLAERIERILDAVLPAEIDRTVSPRDGGGLWVRVVVSEDDLEDLVEALDEDGGALEDWDWRDELEPPAHQDDHELAVEIERRAPRTLRVEGLATVLSISDEEGTNRQAWPAAFALAAHLARALGGT